MTGETDPAPEITSPRSPTSATADHKPYARLREQLLDATPALRRFAYLLTSDADRSDDLVQDTLLRAWAFPSKFQIGTNFTAWLCAILRNRYYSEQRKRRREVEDPNGIFARSLVRLPEQEQRVDLRRIEEEFVLLPENQREALILICAQGFSYTEAAKICGAAEGTIKSRVRRARIHLMECLRIEERGHCQRSRRAPAQIEPQVKIVSRIRRASGGPLGNSLISSEERGPGHLRRRK